MHPFIYNIPSTRVEKSIKRWCSRNDLQHIFRASFQYSIVLLFLLYSGSASANGIFISKINAVTGVSTESNYFRTQDDERSVRSYFIKPGFDFGFKTSKSNLLFNYVLNANWYDEKDSPPTGKLSADQLDYVGHDMKLIGDTQITERLNIKIGDIFILTRDAGQLDYFSNEITRNKYAKNILKPDLSYQFGDKFTFRVGYQYTDISYLNDTTDDDSTEHRGITNLRYHLSSLNSLDLQYQYWEKNYEKEIPDYTSHQALLVFTRQLKYYKYSLSGGYHKRNFDNDIQDTKEGFVWSLIFSGDRPEMLFSLSQNLNDSALANDYYLATRFNGSIAHIFMEKLKVSLKGYYQYSDYLDDPADRKDNTEKIACRVSYLKNDILSFGIEGGVEARNSSNSENDYNDVYVSIGLQLTHDFGSK